MRIRRLCFTLASLCSLPLLAAPLEEGFAQPPDSARPRVWWHWMDGNVTPSGILQDLQWMKRTGIGGMQQFDGNLHTPQVVAQRAVYGSAEWQSLLRVAATEAQRLGLEMAVASAPGWSETGGPWVRPEQAMKKLVWSELTIDGATHPQSLLLPQPPTVAGPYLDIAARLENPDAAPAPWYRDIAVLAVPAGAPTATPARILSRDHADVARQLSDGLLGDPVNLPLAADGQTWVTLSYSRPETFRALTLALPAARGFGAAPLPTVTLQASADGAHYTDIAPVPLSTAPQQTIAFPAHTAQHWRVRLQGAANSAAPPAAPGVLLPPFGQPATTVPLSEVTLHAEPRVHRAEEKAGYAAAPDYYAIDTPSGTDAPGTIAAGDIIDLSARMRADGHLDWTPPPGRWTVLRFGYTLTGKQNGPAPSEATGLEVDKLSATHVRDYLHTYLGKIEQAVGPDLIGQRGVRALLNDSIESGFQNWTDDMAAAFQSRRGYALTRWLPAITGRIVDSVAASDHFLWDFRRTIGELFSDSHYATIAREVHQRGMKVYGEALEDQRPQLGDDMDMRRHADVPMAAMWSVPAGGQPRPTFVADVQGAASVAHVWGQNLVAAESMTVFGQPWNATPRDLKKTADIEFALGVNRIVLHTSAHQPLDGVTPGMSLAPLLGQYFSRHETWADQARPWIDYLARSAYLLQQGRHVADIAYFYGEDAPITGLFGNAPNRDVPAGYAYDYVNLTALRQQLSVRGNQLLSRSGARYRVLYLGGSSNRMTLGALQRIAALARAGATVVGKRPQGTPSLADDRRAFERLADSLWGAAGSRASVRRVGRGSVDGGGHLGAALARIKLAPSVQIKGAGDDVMVTQRHSGTHEIYFIANTGGATRTIEALFRDGHDSRQAPEIWQADSGCIAAAPHQRDGDAAAVRLPLRLAPQQSLFVVFPRAATPGRAATLAEPTSWTTLDQPWQLTFAPGRGAPDDSIRLTQLQSWTQSPIPGIRYFSGTATYSTTISVGAGAPARVILDLGEVRDIARVRLNGKDAGIAWKPPYRIDLGQLLQAGDNRLEVDVTNPWQNRLIGDAQPGATSITNMRGVYDAQAPLRESGLIGPVRLLTAPAASCLDGAVSSHLHF
ncbi:glycoside hydrolase [Duganella sp. FT94W]|uniref:Glycoside hydrolase n=1 Tax=Duganella lactea TaxID=2692173 RepID=A0ABW9V720_9BURK|nr:glycosyl hydrolase [Duganella lactea]MYM34524.1 glycoside hydrolase [Duganella lactea]